MDTNDTTDAMWGCNWSLDGEFTRHRIVSLGRGFVCK